MASARAATAVAVIACCAVSAWRATDAPVPTRTVTELVSVVQWNGRAAAAVPSSAAPAPANPASASEVPKAARPQPVKGLVRTRDAARPVPPKPDVAARVERAPLQKKGAARAPTVVAARDDTPPPTLPRWLRPVRAWGLTLQGRLVRAGVVPACDGGASCEGPERHPS